MGVEKLIPAHEIPDSDEQLRLLEEMVNDQREARVYLIRDAREGCGKTLLLRKLHHACKALNNPPRRIVPTLIDLEDHTDPTHISLIRAVAENLELQLPNYDYLQLALDSRQPGPFMGLAVASGVDLRGATVRDRGQVATIIVNEGGQVHVPAAALPQWHDDLRPRAEKMIISAFFDDLRALPDDLRVAIFIDSVDQKASSPDLKRWVVESLLEKVFLELEKRPKNVLLCVAGRDLADYTRAVEKAELKLIAPQLLTTWQPQHTEAFFRFMLSDPLTETSLNALHEMITRGAPLAQARQAAQYLIVKKVAAHG